MSGGAIRGTPRGRPGDIAGTHRYGVVLALVVLSFMFTITAPKGEVDLLGSVVLASAVLLAALRAAGTRAPARHAALAVIVVALGVAVATIATGDTDAERGSLFLMVGAFVVWAPLAITRGVVEQVRNQGVTLNSVAGAIAIYLLVGMFFGFVVVGIGDLAPSPYFAQQSATTLSDGVYYSFITLSTVGYGDLTPALGIGRGLAALEGVSGQLYLVTVVAVLVSNIRGRRSRSSPDSTAGITDAGGGQPPR